MHAMELDRRKRPLAEIVCVGTELLSGKVNTHTAYLSVRLRCAGFDVRRETTAADDIESIRDAVSEALGRAQAVLVCGGLGPTFDDLTREGAAAALGLRLVYRPELYAAIRRKYRRCGQRSMKAADDRQSHLLEGARAVPNKRGSAPGQLLQLPGKTLALLPGPFIELQPMFERSVLPALKARHPARSHRCSTVLRFCGVAEAAADEQLSSLLRKPPAWAEFTILAGPSMVDMHLAAEAPSAPAARRRLASLKMKVLRCLGRYLYGEGLEAALESAVGERLRRRGWTLSLAESCTGGLVGRRVTAAPGSSDYFAGGVVAYADEAKARCLGVRRSTLRRFGAVSAACAKEMAEGSRRIFGADAAIALTGIAGPGGGTAKKPVGTVFIALSLRGRTLVKRFLFPGSREQVRERAANGALGWLYRKLQK
ncbi:MAG: competence/damage-inducible protein A [Elusimicrobiota bacterium]